MHLSVTSVANPGYHEVEIEIHEKRATTLRKFYHSLIQQRGTINILNLFTLITNLIKEC